MKTWATSCCFGLCLALTTNACTSREKAAPAPPTQSPAPLQVEAATVQTDASTAREQPDEELTIREIQPLNPGDKYCMEMYSACSGTPEQCTSAQLRLDCGETARIPGTRGALKCVCQ